ncbi:MAG: flagellar biosynthesis protein FlhA [Planctomycetota bacterium]|jgi:flagellar biosynthesis protein FlhA
MSTVAPVQQTDSNFAFAGRSETLLSVTFLLTLVVLLIPLPTVILDMLLAVNLAGAILLLMVTLNARKPLDVSVFPSLLLLLTIFRLSLNVATTRLILLEGDAGKIVATFGDFVVGGNLVVGLVIFAILVTIQFIVITKGATRISEVNARFTLDAMPGKQMAIDAELNMGAIDEKEASRRRQNLTREAEFFGAMDGASKYVRGDAIAGLIILAVNILGGIVRGVMNGQTFLEAIEFYSILTIGDGLVSQIPALVIAVSAGILVTKSSSDSSLGQEIGMQASRSSQSLLTGAGILALVAFTPGFPKIPFFLLAGAVALFAQSARRKQAREQAAPEAPLPKADDGTPPEEKNLQQFLQTDRIVVEVGAGLLAMVDPKTGAGIANLISKKREEVARQFGFWVPRVRIRDNLMIDVSQYRLLVGGREVGRGELRPSELLAINPGNVKADIPGDDTIDPAFGMPARWIAEASRRRAEMMGFIVVEAAEVLATHLMEVVRRHAHELLNREDLQKMLAKLKETSPTIVEELRPETLRPAVLHQVLVNLMQEQVPITALELIVEGALQYAAATKDPGELTEKVRGHIGHLIIDRFRDEQGRARVLYLEPKLEHQLRQMLFEGNLSLSPRQLQRMVERLRKDWEMASLKNQPIALIVDSTVRRPLRRAVYRSLPDLSIVAYSEIPTTTLINATSMVRFADVFDEASGETEAFPGTGITPDPAAPLN